MIYLDSQQTFSPKAIMNKPIVEILSDVTALVDRSLVVTINQINNALKDKGQVTMALAGGNTPKPLYQALANQNLPWEKIHIFWGDERYVPADHPDSNERMAREAWLNKIDIPASNIYPMPTGSKDPAIDALQYEASLRQFFQAPVGTIPCIDIILLGLGDDGHTASLFPHTDALKVKDHLVTVGNKDGQPRLTLTIPMINQAHCVIFMVAGANKQKALAQIFAPMADAEMYPARSIQPQGEFRWLLDQAAGENFPK